MEFNINEYKLKHMVSINPNLIKNIDLDINIEGMKYTFNSNDVNNIYIEFVHYFQYNDIKLALGPVEKKLKEFTKGKSFDDFSKYELYEIRFSKFNVKINGKNYPLEIRGAGPVALKISLFMKFSDIDSIDNPLEKKLKTMLRRIYTKLIENNETYKEKLLILKIESDKEEEKQAKIKEEVRREEEEKRRKMEELEKILNSNKPKNNENPFKRF